jgi:hypothetical protein
MATKFWAVLINNSWVEIRTGPTAPVAKTSKLILNIPTKKSTLEYYEDSIGRRRNRVVLNDVVTPHTLNHTTYVGGTYLCTLPFNKFYEICRRSEETCVLSTHPVVELGPALKKKFTSKLWLKRNIIFVAVGA